MTSFVNFQGTIATIMAAYVTLTLLPGATGAEAGGASTPSGLRNQAGDLPARASEAFAAGHLDEADHLYAKALGLDPGSPSILVNAAAVKTRLGRIQESMDLLRKAIAVDVGNKAAWLLLGMNALDQDQNEEAFADLARAVLLDPVNPRARNYLGMAAGRKGWSEASETELRRAVELNSGYADANFNLAVLYLGRKPPLAELARRHYQRALDLGMPRDPSVDKLLNNATSPADRPSSATPTP